MDEKQGTVSKESSRDRTEKLKCIEGIIKFRAERRAVSLSDPWCVDQFDHLYDKPLSELKALLKISKHN